MGMKCRMSQQATFAAGGLEARRYEGLPEGTIVPPFRKRVCIYIVGGMGRTEEELHLPAFEEEAGAAGRPEVGPQVEFQSVPMRQGCGRPRAGFRAHSLLVPTPGTPAPANTPQLPHHTLACSPGEATWHSHHGPVPAAASSL